MKPKPIATTVLTPISTTADVYAACLAWNGDEVECAHILLSALESTGIKPRDLAAELQVDPSSISRWASGKNHPHPIIWKKIISSLKRRTAPKQKQVTGTHKSVTQPDLMAAKRE